MNTTITLVIAWGSLETGPLGMCFAGNLRHARQMAEELQKDYPGTQRISYVREVGCSFFLTRGSLEEVPQPPSFHTVLPEEGWEAEWITERRAAEAQIRREKRD